MASVWIFSIIFVCSAGMCVNSRDLTVGWQNVALSSNGSTCKTNTAFADLPCTFAISGLLWPSQGWNAVQQGVGIWIQVNFKQEYVLTYARLMQPFGNHEQSRMVRLVFSDGTSMQEHLAKRSATTWTSYFGQHWDEFSIDHIRTTFVRIEVLEVYSTSNNGFIEVEFYTGINPCQIFYTFLDGKCYRYFNDRQLSWPDARQICQHNGGELINLNNEAEMATVIQWLVKALDIKARFWVSNRELTPSNVSFPDSPLGDGGTDVMDNRTALYMPQKTLNYEISKSLLRYICEAEPSFKEWRYVPSTSDADPLPVPVALTARKGPELNYKTVVGFLTFCVITILILLSVIVIGGYKFNKRLRILGMMRTESEHTLCSNI